MSPEPGRWAAEAMPGVVAVYTGADLVAAGVKPIPGALAFKRADGSPCAFKGITTPTSRFGRDPDPKATRAPWDDPFQAGLGWATSGP